LEEPSKRENSSSSDSGSASTPIRALAVSLNNDTWNSLPQGQHSARTAESAASRSSDKGKSQAKNELQSYYGRQYLSHTKSTFIGQHYVEGYLEKRTEGDAKT
jgi:hypothetical protein